MTGAHEDAYLESRVYSATPAELIQILYETALQSVHEALEAEASAALDDVSRITARARGVSRASSCVMELAGSLNVQVGGELGVRLAVLYEYLLHELLEASKGRQTEPLRNAERVLAALLDGWSRAVDQVPAEAPESHDVAEEGDGSQRPSMGGEAAAEAGSEEYAATSTGGWSA